MSQHLLADFDTSDVIIDPSPTTHSLATPPIDSSWSPRDWLAVILCAVAGLFLAVEPHLATLAHDGTLDFVADNDDDYYLALCRPAYQGELVLRDAFAGPWEHVPELHAWSQFVPSGLAARLLGVPLVLVGLLWRVGGGAFLGFSLYYLFRRLLGRLAHPTAWALGCALACLADAGFVGGKVFVENFNLLYHMSQGTTPLTKPAAIPHFRIVTPLTNLPFLILLFAILMPSGRKWMRDAVVGALSLALCVYLYFYFWTAAVGALCMLIGLWVLRAWLRPADRRRALAEAGLAAAVLAGGLALGAPQIYGNVRTFRDPEMKAVLERANKGTVLDPSDPLRWRYVRNFWTWGKLAAGAVGLLALDLPGLGAVWCLVLAAYALTNVAVVTGLEFENFHWGMVHIGFGEVLLLAVLCGGFSRWLPQGKRSWLLALWLLPAALLLVAAAWRPYEALHAPEAVRYSQDIRNLRSLRRALGALGGEETLAGPMVVNTALLYSRCAVLFSTPYTPITLIPLEDAHRRHALNAALQGLDLAAYQKVATPPPSVVSHVHEEEQPEAVARARIRIFQELVENPRALTQWADHYRVTYLLLPTDAPAPREAGPWTQAARNEVWSLWARKIASP